MSRYRLGGPWCSLYVRLSRQFVCRRRRFLALCLPLVHLPGHGVEGLFDLALVPALQSFSTGAIARVEIILALGSDVEGEATAHYLADLLRELPVAVTRLAQGLPAGGGLEQADELTLSRALAGRTTVKN